jgi:CRISPR/Cas system CSM-associated protein Csm3 (group 7 of RAMP superfamily)
MASLARASLKAAGCREPEQHPAFIALFGSARGSSNGEGQESRLKVFDSRHVGAASLVRDRNAINRRRGSADKKRLFHEEVIDGTWSFPLTLEFLETGPRTSQELQLQNHGTDPDALARRLLFDVLRLLEAGWASIGGNSGIGYGRFRLENCRVMVRNRCSPDEVLAYARDRWGAKDSDGNSVFLPQSLQDVLGSAAAIPVNGGESVRPPERIRFRCTLRPLEPLLVKTGYTAEIRGNVGSRRAQQENLQLTYEPVPQEFAVDAGFCLDARGRPYVPGSSLRGALRSHVERVVRTIAGDAAAWDLQQAQDKGQEFSEYEDFKENNVECLVSRVFGFSALGGRILFSDAVPLYADRFECRRKLLDHVALDRFTGGAADKRKFNSRPYFPPGPPSDVGTEGDLECEIELYDFDAWHLGMLLLMLRDLRLGRVMLGHGKNKGFGRLRLEHVEIEILTAAGGVLEAALPPDAPSLGGFKTFSVALCFEDAGYLCQADGVALTTIFRRAEEAIRDQMRNWQPGPVPERGVTP